MVELVSAAAQKLHSIEIAKELVQDVFLNLHRRRNDLQTNISLKAYLFTALKNKIINYYHRQLSKQKYELYEENNLRVAANNVSEEYEAKELNQFLYEKINKLSPQCRKVFLLSREEHLTQKEIANRLNISINTVDQHIQKALRLLRISVSEMQLLVLMIISN